MAVLGLGLDVCSVERIRKILSSPRSEKFLQRVFTTAERSLCEQRLDSAPAFAARFAAKEALVKALGAPKGIRWTDMEVAREGAAPFFRLSGVAMTELDRRGARAWLALTHDAGVAAASVILEGEGA